MDHEVRDILVGMKTALSEGWIQGELQTEQGVCVYGALATTGAMMPSWGTCGPNGVKGRVTQDIEPGPMLTVYPNSPADKAMTMLCLEVGVKNQNELALWNDEEGRTVDDIINAIDALLLRGTPKPKRSIFRRFALKEKGQNRAKVKEEACASQVE